MENIQIIFKCPRNSWPLFKSLDNLCPWFSPHLSFEKKLFIKSINVQEGSEKKKGETEK